MVYNISSFLCCTVLSRMRDPKLPCSTWRPLLPLLQRRRCRQARLRPKLQEPRRDYRLSGEDGRYLRGEGQVVLQRALA